VRKKRNREGKGETYEAMKRSGGKGMKRVWKVRTNINEGDNREKLELGRDEVEKGKERLRKRG